jgi:DNA polymerase-3 subunit gamma/tau
MGQALYRKYRSKSLDEVIGQDHITKTLKQAIKQGRISHAYLFTGPRGVGKTSVARILAHDINGLPYTDESAHMDIIEIDAASNRRIDEIRDLRDKVHVAPTSAKYKVYIIDEVHMLTREAFNALLKTLEEPPAHVVFILATTDAHKLPATIISRTQRFSFKPVEAAQVIDHLRNIAKQEKITVSDEALALLAEHGEGSFRDSISLLDQSGSLSKPVEADDIRQLLGVPSAAVLDELLESVVAEGRPAAVVRSLESLYDQGYQAAAIAKRLGRAIRAALVEDRSGLEPDAALSLLKQLIEVPASHDPERALEIALLQALPPATQARSVAPVSAPAEPAPQPEIITDIKPATGALDAASWPLVLQTLKARHNTLYGVIRMAQPEFAGSTLKLAFGFGFHQKRLKENSNQQKLADVIKAVTGQTVGIECLLDKTATPFAAPAPKEPDEPPLKAIDNDLAAISNIFGKAELLES